MVSITADSAVQYFPSVLSENVSSMFIAAIKYFNFFYLSRFCTQTILQFLLQLICTFIFLENLIFTFSLYTHYKKLVFFSSYLSSSFEAEIKPGCPEFLHCEHIIFIFLVLCDCIYNDE